MRKLPPLLARAGKAAGWFGDGMVFFCGGAEACRHQRRYWQWHVGLRAAHRAHLFVARIPIFLCTAGGITTDLASIRAAFAVSKLAPCSSDDDAESPVDRLDHGTVNLGIAKLPKQDRQQFFQAMVSLLGRAWVVWSDRCAYSAQSVTTLAASLWHRHAPHNGLGRETVEQVVNRIQHGHGSAYEWRYQPPQQKSTLVT